MTGPLFRFSCSIIPNMVTIAVVFQLASIITIVYMYTCWSINSTLVYSWKYSNLSSSTYTSVLLLANIFTVWPTSSSYLRWLITVSIPALISRTIRGGRHLILELHQTQVSSRRWRSPNLKSISWYM